MKGKGRKPGPRANPRPAAARGRSRPPAGFDRRDAVALVILFVAGLAIWAPVIEFPFLNWDDQAYVSENPVIRTLEPMAVLRLFSLSTVVVANWAPLTLFSYAVDHAIGGLDPSVYHATNLLLHLIAGLLVYLLLRSVFGQRSPAFAGALLFLLHPIQAESVAWVAERKNVLSLPLMLAAFLVARSARGTNALPRHVIALALFALALMAKATVVVLPLLLIAAWTLLDREPARRAWWRAVPYLALSLAAGLVTLATQGEAGGIKAPWGGSLELTVATMLRVFWLGVANLLAPRRLSAIYDPPVATSTIEPSVIAAGLALVALIAIVVRARHRAPRAVFLAAWYLIGLLPVSNLVPLPHLLADRFLYVSSVGFAGLAALAIAVAAKRFAPAPRATLAIIVAAMVLGGAAGAATRARLPVWQSSEQLWRDTLEKNPRAAVAHANLGEVLAGRGEHAAALEHYRRALEIRPDYPEARINLANAMARLGQTAAAESLYASAITQSPADAEARHNLGVVRQQAGDLAGARAAFEAAVRIDPRHARALNNLAVIVAGDGDLERALGYLDRAVAADPANAEALSNRGLILGRLGRQEEARASIERAIQVRPDYAQAHFNLGIALLAGGDREGARGAFARAVELDPRLAPQVPPPAR